MSCPKLNPKVFLVLFVISASFHVLYLLRRSQFWDFIIKSRNFDAYIHDVKLISVSKKKLINGKEGFPEFGDSKVAICFINSWFRPVPIRRRMYNLLASIRKRDEKISVFILIDKIEKSQLQSTEDGVYYLSVKNTLPVTLGFHSLTFGQGQANGWDKAIFVFSKIFKSFEFIWFIEDDVYIPSAEVFFGVHNQIFRHKQVEKDLVIAMNLTNYDGSDIDGWNWRFASMSNLSLPWFGSLVPAMGMSRALLKECSQHAESKSALAFLEVFFTTIAAHSMMRVLVPPEFSSIVFDYPWKCDDFAKNPSNWFHPVKSILHCSNNSLRAHSE